METEHTVRERVAVGIKGNSLICVVSPCETIYVQSAYHSISEWMTTIYSNWAKSLVISLRKGRVEEHFLLGSQPENMLYFHQCGNHRSSQKTPRVNGSLVEEAQTGFRPYTIAFSL